MSNATFGRGAAAAFVGLCLCFGASRQFAWGEEKPTAAKPAEATSADAKPAQSHEAMMAEWEKMNKAGKEHAAFKAMAGEFTADVKSCMGPGTPMASSTGKERNELILDGRFLQSHFTGEMMGKPFAGQGLMGYDTMKKKYVNTWIDSMSTMIMVGEGTADADGKVFTLMSEMKDPSGKPEKMRQVTTLVDKDTYTYHMYMSMPDGSDYKCLDITFKRVK